MEKLLFSDGNITSPIFHNLRFSIWRISDIIFRAFLAPFLLYEFLRAKKIRDESTFFLPVKTFIGHCRRYIDMPKKDNQSGGIGFEDVSF